MEIAVFEAGGGLVWPKISDRKGHPSSTIIRVGKLDESNFHMVDVGKTFVRFVTIHACERRTDRQTDGRTHGRTALR